MKGGHWGTSEVSNKVSNAGVENPVAPAPNFVHTLGMTLEIKQLSGVDSRSAVSSVVEHFLDTEGVRGSNPLSRTIPNRIKCFVHYLAP